MKFELKVLKNLWRCKAKFKIHNKQIICTQMDFSDDQSLRGSSRPSADRFRSSSRGVHERALWVSWDLYFGLLPANGASPRWYEWDEGFGKPVANESPKASQWTRNRPTSAQKTIRPHPRTARVSGCGQGSSFLWTPDLCSCDAVGRNLAQKSYRYSFRTSCACELVSPSTSSVAKRPPALLSPRLFPDKLHHLHFPWSEPMGWVPARSCQATPSACQETCPAWRIRHPPCVSLELCRSEDWNIHRPSRFSHRLWDTSPNNRPHDAAFSLRLQSESSCASFSSATALTADTQRVLAC